MILFVLGCGFCLVSLFFFLSLFASLILCFVLFLCCCSSTHLSLWVSLACYLTTNAVMFLGQNDDILHSFTLFVIYCDLLQFTSIYICVFTHPTIFRCFHSFTLFVMPFTLFLSFSFAGTGRILSPLTLYHIRPNLSYGHMIISNSSQSSCVFGALISFVPHFLSCTTTMYK